MSEAEFTTVPNAGIGLVTEREKSDFTELIPGIEVSRSISDSTVTVFGGGLMKFTEDATMQGEITYDEVFFVLKGALEIESDGRTLTGEPNDILLLKKGTNVVYRGKPGTEAFYVLFPRSVPND